MKLADPSMGLLAATGGDTVKLFDVSVESGDPCTLTYSPSPACIVNSVKWNHTNLVLASAGEDKRISLWRKNGQSMGTIPTGTESGDNIEESILAINFSNKGSRYMCSGGSGQVVRIWDLQRKRCIKRLRGHSSTITGAMYNCKDEDLASISLSGDIILHNLASSRATELKDPNRQVLRVLDCSKVSRHLLVTAGDDGSVHLWDTTGRSPKVSWLKQHSAPTAGISFSPSNDKVIASVGLDKKLYTYDSGSRKPPSCIAHEVPFSSMAFRDDGWILAAGTSNGRVVFYDVRGKPQPFIVLRAYNNSEAVTSLCWQRSKPTIVNERCTAEIALLGGTVEYSILMPDPLPSVTSSVSLSTSMYGPYNMACSGTSVESVSLAATGTGVLSSSTNLSLDEIPQRTHHFPGLSLTRLHARSSHTFKNDMDVFSPLVDVHPVTPSLDKLFSEGEGCKRDNLLIDKKPQSLFSPYSSRFPFAEDGPNYHPIFDSKFTSTSKQEDTKSLALLGGSTPTPSSKSEDSAITPTEAWGGEQLSDKPSSGLQPLPIHFAKPVFGGLTSGPMVSGLQDSSSMSQASISFPNSNLNFSHLCTKDATLNQEASTGFPKYIPPSPMSISQGNRGIMGRAGLDASGPVSLTLPRRLSTYAERISTAASFSDTFTPETKKTGAETREELSSSLLLSRSDTSAMMESAKLPAINEVGASQSHKASQSDIQQGSSVTVQLFKSTLEQTLESFQRSIHEDTRNIHIEILRQFHMQEMEFSGGIGSILETQAELMKELKSLRKENQELRQLL